MIKCTRCKQDKDETAYRLVGKRRTKLCAYCRAVAVSAFHKSNYKHRGKYTERMRERGQTLRLLVLQKYGGKCLCCGERDYRFLTLDHKNNDGASHRKEIGGRSYAGSHITQWAWRNGYPDTLQCLCYNCNCARHRNGGVCPHEGTPIHVPDEPVLMRVRVQNKGTRRSDKMTQEIADTIKRRVAAGEKQSALAREYAVSPQAVCDVMNGRHWVSPAV